MPDDPTPPSIQIDDDWKAQARAEKQRLSGVDKPPPAAPAAAEETAGPGPAAGADAGRAQGAIPPATFETLVSTLATQSIMAMGGMADPRTGEPMLDLDLARHHIDTLSVLEAKTQNNLEDAERDLLGAALYELRSRYVQLSQASRPSAR
ncbi:MAG: DUF1844 domain-containing protein [Planctomycetota bacterium]